MKILQMAEYKAWLRMKDRSGHPDKKIQYNWIYIVGVLIAGFAFFFLIGEHGTVFFRDSETFIKWSYADKEIAYPLYPAFLRLIRLIHGEERYLDYVFAYQGLFSVVANILLVEFIRKKYSIGYIVGFALHILILGTYSFTLPEAVSSHYIATESISIPIFILSVFFLLKYYADRSYICMIMSIVSGFAMYKARPQLLIFFVVYIGLSLFNEIYRIWGSLHKKAFWISSAVLFLAGCLGCIFIFFRLIGSWETNTHNTQMIEALTGKALCLLKEEDINLYSGDDRDIYRVLYADVESREAFVSDFPSSVLDYEQVQVKINENVTAHETVIWNYFIDKQGDDGGADAFAVRNRITAGELTLHKAGFAGIVMRLMPSSLVASIFIQPRSIRTLCYALSGVLYLAAVGFIMYGVIKKIAGRYLVPLSFSLLLILANALASNIVLYGQQRYVVYCMGLFYISMIIALFGILEAHGNGFKEDNKSI